MTSQEPPDSVIQLAAAGWKNDCMSNCCVVDLVGCKQKKKKTHDVSIAAFYYFQRKVGEGNLAANSTGFPTQHAGFGVSYLEEPSTPDVG